MTVNLADKIQVVMEMPFGINMIQNRYHVSLTGPGALTDVQALDDLIELFEALALLIKLIAGAGTIIDRIRAINLTSLADVGTAPFVTTRAGSASGEVAALQVALGVQFGTARLNAVGRKFYGPATESQMGAAGALSSGVITQLVNIVNFLITEQSMTNGDWRFGIVSTIDAAFLPLENGSVAIYPHTQRRRRPGVGA